MKTVLIVLLSLFAVTYADFAKEILEEHNKIRRALGIKELVWSDEIAKSAQEWSDYLAENKLFKHSRTKGVGENLARGTARTHDASRLFKSWVNEVQYFIPGKNYPECSTTGKGGSVGHYTQIVWGRTSQLGCGFSIGAGKNGDLAYLLCQYKTPGNYINSPVYVVTVPPVVTDPPVEDPEDDIPPAEETDDAPPVEQPDTEIPPAEETDEEEPPVDGTTPTTKFPSLTSADFKAKADASSPNWSYTKWDISYLFNTRTSGSKIRVTMNSKCKIEKTKSWVKSGYFDSTLLTHENGHWYIGSLLALNFKKQSEATVWAKATYKADITKLYNDMLASYVAMEKKYDTETNNGLNKTAQKKWMADLINQINGLKDFWW